MSWRRPVPRRSTTPAFLSSFRWSTRFARAWVKNDHLGFEIMYVCKGVVKKYRPDFLIRLATGKTLVLEVTGQDAQQNRTKREFLAEWVKAVNVHGGFGQWAWNVPFDTSDLPELLAKHADMAVGV